MEYGANPPSIPTWKWRLVWLMFLATMINYMDRQALLQTEKQITEQFQLTNEDFGGIEKYFGITFACTQIFAGFLCDRASIRWIYASALLIWSAAGFATGLVTTINGLIACRMVLAFGESFNWPCAVGVVKRIMPRESQSLANGIFHGGASIGGIMTPLVTLVVVGLLGLRWPWVFFVIGGGGALWALAWLIATRGDRRREIDSPPADVGPRMSALEALRSFAELFRSRPIYVATLVGVSVNICWHIPRFWLTKYLRQDLGFGPNSVQWLTIAYFLSADLGSMSAGWLTRRLIRSGWSVEAARKCALGVTGTTCLVAIPAMWINTPWITLPLLMLFAAGAMGGFANYFALTQEVSPHHTSMVLGLTGFFGWGTVAFLQGISGRYADVLGCFWPIIMAASITPLIGALIGLAWPAHPVTKSNGGGE